MITRFAPSPTGPLHVGHAFSALTAHGLAQRSGGAFLLRMEDIDTARCTPEFETQIYDDLSWLGLSWPQPVMRQSSRRAAYDLALEKLSRLDVIYACTCTRANIRAALSAPQEGAPLTGPDGIIYPGTCRDAGHSGDGAALRLNMKRAAELVGPITFTEIGPEYHGQQHFTSEMLIDRIGDVVLARRDLGTSYHLAVCADDAHQGITHVVRGADLFDATAIHVVLQRLLGLPTPIYQHHRLIRDDTGKRLAKRDDARAIAHYREIGRSVKDIRAMIGL